LTERGCRAWLTAALAAWAVGTLTVEALAAAGMLGATLAVLATQRAAEPGQHSSGVDQRAWLIGFWPVGLFVAWALLAPSVAGHPPSGTEVARTAQWMAVPVAATAWARMNGRARRVVLGAAGLTFVASCAVAGLQHFGVWPPLGAFEPFRFTRIPFERVYEPVSGATERFMAGGLAFHRLRFAHVGGIAVLALLVAALSTRGAARAAALVGAAVGIVAIAVFPYARAASAALLVACVVAGALAHPRRGWALGVGTLLAVFLVLAGAAIAPLRERFASSITASGSGDRHLLVSAGLAVVRKHPVVGLGPGNFRALEHVPIDAPEHLRAHRGKAHNQFVSVAAETGIVGALLFCVMLAALALRMRPETPHGVFGLAMLLFFVLLSLAHDPLFHSTFYSAFILALGIGCARRPPVGAA
jgi:O-antigen ligase